MTTYARTWGVSAAATAISTYALDLIATAAGVALVAAGLLGNVGHGWLLVLLVLSYAAWGFGLRAGVRANAALLAKTGVSTNVVSKAAHDLARRLTARPWVHRWSAAAGYVGTEAAKEAPYYAGAFGLALVTDPVTSDEALVFLVGANVGAMLYEYGVARLTHGFLRRRTVPPLVGARLTVPLVGGGRRRYANLLPWRRRHCTLLPLPSSPAEALDQLEQALSRSRSRIRLVTVTGASNVTGEIWPYAEMARTAHRHDARILVDAAQLAPHRCIDMALDGIDYLALSGHKLYARFGAGALIGTRDWLGSGEPFLAGGGAVRYVGADTVLWADLPDRQEAGSPNVIGAVALGVACRTLQAMDRDGLAAYEQNLVSSLRARLPAVPGMKIHRRWAPEHPRIGVLPFSLAGVPYARLAAILSAEYGIGVRHGCFCAHPLMARLLQIDDASEAGLRDALAEGRPTAMPGAVRASIGLGTTAADCDRLVDAVTEIAPSGARWTYVTTPDGGDCRPDPDPRLIASERGFSRYWIDNRPAVTTRD